MLTWKSTISPTTVQVVLIISDQADVPLLWEATFQEKGFITVQETHENALKTCRVIDPALVVIDIYLPMQRDLNSAHNFEPFLRGRFYFSFRIITAVKW